MKAGVTWGNEDIPDELTMIGFKGTCNLDGNFKGVTTGTISGSLAITGVGQNSHFDIF